MEHIIIIGFCL